MKNSLTLTTLVTLLVVSSAQAQTCNPNITRSAPDSRYDLVVGSGGSEVLDKQTGLIWQRCSVGQRWNGTTCTGSDIFRNSVYSWSAALQQAKNYGSAWRLPNIKELQSLVEEACYNSSINEIFFPATPSYWYWSASPNPLFGDLALFVQFGNGESYYDGFSGYDNKGHLNFVRAVRSGHDQR